MKDLSSTKKTTAAALALSAAVIAPGSQAAVWNSSNVQLLSGNNYELGEEKRTILTYENALGWAYGDSFIFIDVTEPTSEGTAYYSEWSPRFSIGKITGKDMSFGIVKDLMLSTTLEMGSGTSATLVGIGLPLELPGFAFANVNLYARDSQRDFASEQTDIGGQLTLTWKRPFALGATSWSFEGFLDYAFGEDNGSNPKEDNIIAAPRLLLDVGALWDKPGVLEAGVEYQLWRNKFGVDGVDEDVAQAMVKWIF
ncbi:outer membrane protein OmpK [Granulosicoccaceae sp. 1_MG-2023]|nr:outer membrane protein OmpK [Granulosicoccaceae sp. 1_MG-2023]